MPTLRLQRSAAAYALTCRCPGVLRCGLAVAETPMRQIMPSTTEVEIGSVVSLWRYPVKSMMGEELNATDVTERGLLGDRAYALVDSSDGKVASAKNPRKWPGLFDFRATFTEPVRPAARVPSVRIVLPDGTTVTRDQGDLNQVLSKALNREVTLRAAQHGAVTAE